MVVAAERHPAERIDLMVAELGIKPQPARGDDIGRHGDDGEAGADRTLRRLDADAAMRLDRLGRRRQLYRQSLRQSGQQRAKALLAERRRIAFRRLGEIERRDLRQILGAIIGTENEFDRAAPVAEIGRHHLLARDIGLARRVVDSARGAHLRGEKILQFALARKAAADADFLALRRRIDVDAAVRRRAWSRD